MIHNKYCHVSPQSLDVEARKWRRFQRMCFFSLSACWNKRTPDRYWSKFTESQISPSNMRIQQSKTPNQIPKCRIEIRETFCSKIFIQQFSHCHRRRQQQQRLQQTKTRRIRPASTRTSSWSSRCFSALSYPLSVSTPSSDARSGAPRESSSSMEEKRSAAAVWRKRHLNRCQLWQSLTEWSYPDLLDPNAWSVFQNSSPEMSSNSFPSVNMGSMLVALISGSPLTPRVRSAGVLCLAVVVRRNLGVPMRPPSPSAH